MFLFWLVVFQDSSSDEEDDNAGPAVAGKEKRVASERCALHQYRLGPGWSNNWKRANDEFGMPMP